MSETVSQFLRKTMRMISANGPSVALRGEDYLTALEILNDLMSSYGISGQFNPISMEVTVPAHTGQQDYIFADEVNFPDADYTGGRLVATQNAWILFEGVRYPLTDITRNRFNNAALYEIQVGLPLNYIIYDQNDYTVLRLWPAPQQEYILIVDGKIQPEFIHSNTEMTIPDYMTLFLKYATAKECAFGLNRESAWSAKMEERFLDLERQMINKSPRNVDIGRRRNMLNGATLVASGLFLYDSY